MATSDEIDLIKLLGKFIFAIKLNFEIVISLFIVGCGLGYLYYEVAPNKFESRMLVSSDILTESYSKFLIENLQKLVDEDNVQALSKKINVSAKIADEIDDIEVKSALREPADTPENSKMYLNIVARVKSNSNWPQVQAGIISYLQTNEFVKVRVEQRKKYFSQIIEKINLELADLEKLKAKISEGKLIQSDKQDLLLFDPTTVNSTIIDLNKDKLNFQNALETVNSVQVVEGFTIYNKPASPKLSISLIGGALFGLFMAGSVLVFKALRSVLKSYEEKLIKA